MRAVALLLLAVAAAGCAEEPDKFPVVVTVVSDDDKPFVGVPVRFGQSLAGNTDVDGKLRVRVNGKEGQKVVVSIDVPKGYRMAKESAFVLRHLVDLESGGKRPLPIEHTIRLSPLEREYAILVRAGVPGLSVETFGQQKAVTNDKGVAMFLYKGTPGDELQVKISTAGRPELRPQNPTASFLLAQKPEAYVVKEHFSVHKPPAPKRKPKPTGPKRL
jgi:hypothetical protein